MKKYLITFSAVLLIMIFGSGCEQDATTEEAQQLIDDLITNGNIAGLDRPERVVKAGKPPYESGPDPALQRFMISTPSEIIIFSISKFVDSANADDLFFTGTEVGRIPWTTSVFGSLFLQSSDAAVPDSHYTYGPTGGSVCPAEADVLCQIDFDFSSTSFGASNTTDAQCGRDASGVEQCDNFCRVRGGDIGCASQNGTAGAFDLPTSEFNGRANSTLIPDTTDPLITYAPLSPDTGLGATNDGYMYHIDTSTDTATLLSNNIGTDVRTIQCEPLTGGDFGCAVQSYSDKKTTFCVGADETDITCGAPIDTNDAVTPGFAVADNGDMVSVVPSYLDSSIYFLAVRPNLTVPVNFKSPLTEWSTIESDLTMQNPGHAVIDDVNDAVMVSGNGSGNLVVFSIDEMSTHISGATALSNWFN